MKTTHRIINGDSRSLESISDASIDLVVTSPPYPMIAMWDELFFTMNPGARNAFKQNKFHDSFLLMHSELDCTWRETARVLKEGGLACVNIGDATRTVGGEFRLFPNHAVISRTFLELGMSALPVILWRKTTNKPNKFMGSGMLPPGAYVTLEHEYIMIFRKGGKRQFDKSVRARRYESAYFWEERNCWFSDVWTDLVGTGQNLKLLSGESRSRSAAYPLELPARLISMFSLYGDTVLDPFWGTGTTTLASMLCARNSIGIELDSGFCTAFERSFGSVTQLSNEFNSNRYRRHQEFLKTRPREPAHCNHELGMSCITAQERSIRLYTVKTGEIVSPGNIVTHHEPFSRTLS